MGLKNTKTEENLRKALAGESIARNKYTYFAEIARRNGDTDVADAFEQMARNEMMHAKFWFEQLYGKGNDTVSCLMQAARGEFEEWHSMYPEFAKQAREDGLEDLAIMFEKVAGIERSHENRFMALMAQMAKKGKEEAAPAVEEQKTKVLKDGYRCQFCGEVTPDRRDVCSVCGAIGSFEYTQYYE